MIKQLKVGKSHKTYITNHTWFMSHHITPLVINALGGGHRDTHTNVQTKAISKKGDELACSLSLNLW